LHYDDDRKTRWSENPFRSQNPRRFTSVCTFTSIHKSRLFSLWYQLQVLLLRFSQSSRDSGSACRGAAAIYRIRTTTIYYIYTYFARFVRPQTPIRNNNNITYTSVGADRARTYLCIIYNIYRLYISDSPTILLLYWFRTVYTRDRLYVCGRRRKSPSALTAAAYYIEVNIYKYESRVSWCKSCSTAPSRVAPFGVLLRRVCVYYRVYLVKRDGARATAEQGEGWRAHCVYYYYYVFWCVCAGHDGRRWRPSQNTTTRREWIMSWQKIYNNNIIYFIIFI